jgi:hypothetical protein
MLPTPRVIVIEKVLNSHRRGFITVELRLPANEVWLLAGIPAESLYAGILVPVVPIEHPDFPSLSEQGKVWKHAAE